jgi:hypothetical protein
LGQLSLDLTVFKLGQEGHLVFLPFVLIKELELAVMLAILIGIIP